MRTLTIVKITDRQALHVLEHLDTEVAQGSLADLDHQSLLQIGCSDTDCIEDRHPHHGTEERTEIRIRLSDHRHDVGVDQRPREHRSLYVGKDRDEDADDDNDDLYSVAFHDICHYAFEDLRRIVHLHLDAPHLPAADALEFFEFFL